MGRHWKVLFAVFLALVVATPAMAMKFSFHGDLNNRFLVYTDQINFFSSNSSSGTKLDENDAPDSFATIKYRLVAEAETDDGAVKGVYAIELGGLRFGAGGSVGKSQGGSFSGDGVNIETRWAYTDFQLPGVESKARFRVGLQTLAVNPLFWKETVLGVKFYTDSWYLAWTRPDDVQTAGGGDWGDGDLNALTFRYDLKKPVKAGIFVNYFWQDIATPTAGFVDFSTFDAFDNYSVDEIPAMNYSLFAIGLDGKWSTPVDFGKVFVNWDLIYENGSFDDVSVDGLTKTSLDLSAYMLHADLGASFGKATVTYSVYYASGDDNPGDKDLDAYIEVDTDANYSVILNEGGYTDDDYFTDKYTIGDKGIFSHKLALDYQATKKTKVGVALIYATLAEEVTLIDGSKSDKIGTEVDAYVSHKLYNNLEVALNFGFLAADDVLDLFEGAKEDGNSDVDIWRSTAKLRYKF